MSTNQFLKETVLSEYSALIPYSTVRLGNVYTLNLEQQTTRIRNECELRRASKVDQFERSSLCGSFGTTFVCVSGRT